MCSPKTSEVGAAERLAGAPMMRFHLEPPRLARGRPSDIDVCSAVAAAATQL